MLAMSSTILYLARHGEVRGAGEVFYGHEDLPLSTHGAAQASAISAKLRGTALEAVYASDLRRTVEFAEIIAAPHDLEVQSVPALREMSLGVLEGMPIAEAKLRHPELAGRSYASMLDFRMPGGGESLRDVSLRALPALLALVERHRGRAFVVIGHHSVNRILLADVLGVGLGGLFRFDQSYGCLNTIRFGPEGPQVTLLNERPDHPTQVVGDRIRVSQIRFEGAHGWLESERAQRRRFRADILARVSLGRAAKSDDLEDTLDYRALADAVVEVGSGRSFRLLEALCEAIGTELLVRFPTLQAAEVTVYKSAPDLTGEPDEVGVSVFVRRQSA
jgi:dihydroneopterin aldolase